MAIIRRRPVPAILGLEIAGVVVEADAAAVSAG
jgi:NADPH:quinone reductase-like Zn-dependent oxidoreductase